ncbi:MAG: 16S rRNA (cytidine(1402)-2'-O)-methyltransferase [Ignavibacteriales bacterium]|nr:16S rRNA (cytidine(1402)-2'-O)-methyltransferase [Ignavibacteriales bacterium]
MNEVLPSTLYLVSTPIGNLEDITLRALKILGNVDALACEDTRTTQVLLNKYELKPKRLLSYFEQNEQKKIPEIIQLLKDGNSVALVTDAGTPSISDPGFRLVRAAIEEGISVVPIPGVSAVITALSASGLPTNAFVFEGFLPVKKGRKTRLEFLKEETRTIIFYESPYRVLRTLNDLKEVFGEREVVIARELTKKFEEFLRGNFSEVIEQLSKKKILGEFVVMVKGKE